MRQRGAWLTFSGKRWGKPSGIVSGLIAGLVNRLEIEVVTEGILTRRLQADPELEGVGLLIFDEFHERSLQTDLGLALARQVQEVLRDDLKILLMSATIESGRLSRALGGAPIVKSEGRQFPVENAVFTKARHETDRVHGGRDYRKGLYRGRRGYSRFPSRCR